MKENGVFTENRLELSQKTTALYPEFSDGWPDLTLERMFMQRSKRAGKELWIGRNGSPNHGEQKWTFEGPSKFFVVTEDETGTQSIQEDRVVIIDNLLDDLRNGSIALFTEYDVTNAKNVSALPKEFMDDPTALINLVAKDKQNGIIVIANRV